MDHAFHIEIGTKVRRVTCPNCKKKTKYVHGYRMQRVQGRMIEERPVVFHLRKRRYIAKRLFMRP
ncbi:transposase family protein [Siminovitchia terrae]|uniref:transposase family protein n=1 Tax=Siminovitchia terrae TaxID=1914933 RepID=UPI001BB4328B